MRIVTPYVVRLLNCQRVSNVFQIHMVNDNFGFPYRSCSTNLSWSDLSQNQQTTL